MIQTIDTVFINGKNKAFGGYIYNVDYNASFGESPSLLKVTLVNENGIYSIDQTDLSLVGNATSIMLGTNIQLFMYLIQYELENSPKGKLLQLQYVDESVFYLDNNVVKLKARGVNNESWSNTFVVGEELNRVDIIGAGPASASVIINPDAYVTNIRVTEVLYTFYQLLDAIEGTIPLGALPPIDTQVEGYFQTYAGNLREVLSAWCNDLGYGFYWENRCLNFIDLRNPANFTAVSAYANAIVAANNIQQSNTSYSLHDTISRGCYSFFGKDGMPIQDNPIPTGNAYSFNCLTTDNIPWVAGYSVGPATIFDLPRVQGAYYGPETFLLSSLTSLPTAGSLSLNSYSAVVVNNNNPDLAVVTRGTNYQNTYSGYNWWKVTVNNTQPFDTIYSQYKAIADFWGSFFYYEMTSDQVSQLQLSATNKWYGANTPMPTVDLLDNVLSPLSPLIQNYTGLTLDGFIRNINNDVIETNANAQLSSTEGYLIIQNNGTWNPVNNVTLFSANNTVIIEGPNNVAQFNSGLAVAFYVGINVQQGNTVPNFSAIQMPQTIPITIFGKPIQTTLAITDYFPRVEFEGYIPPLSLNVNKKEINFVSISEDQIVSASSSTINRNAAAVGVLRSQMPSTQNTPDYVIWSNNFNGANSNLIGSYVQALSLNNFAIAFELFGAALTFSQPGPFYNVSFTVPNINLIQSVLSSTPLDVSNGLNSISVSIGDNGISTTYTVGTQLMKLRSPNVFFRYRYQFATKNYSLLEFNSVLLQTPTSEIST